MRFLLSLAAAFAISIAIRVFSDSFMAGWLAAILWSMIDQAIFADVEAS